MTTLRKVTNCRLLGNNYLVLSFYAYEQWHNMLLFSQAKKMLFTIDPDFRGILPAPWVIRAFNNSYKVISIRELVTFILAHSRHNPKFEQFLVDKINDLIRQEITHTFCSGEVFTDNYVVDVGEG